MVHIMLHRMSALGGMPVRFLISNPWVCVFVTLLVKLEGGISPAPGNSGYVDLNDPCSSSRCLASWSKTSLGSQLTNYSVRVH